MTNPEKVHGFLKAQRPEGFCDDCVEKNTKVDRHEVNVIASMLALFPREFVRSSAICPQGCSSRAKLVTSSK
jgi:hypothetical protein